MYRKAMRILAVTLVLSVLAITGELTVLASVRAPAQTLLQATGALPQAPVDQIHPAGDTAPVVDGPSPLANCKSMAEWARPAGWASAPAVAMPKINLGQVTILGQELVRGAYENRTAPSGFESALTGVELPIRDKAPTLLLAAIMLLLVVLAARHSSPVEEEALVVHSAPRICASQPAEQLKFRWPQFGPRILGFQDRTADWERVRLVPT